MPHSFFGGKNGFTYDFQGGTVLGIDANLDYLN